MSVGKTTSTDSGFARTPNTELFEMTEQELVREILFGSSRLYEFFGFAMTDVHGLRAEDGWNYLFFGNLLRMDIGLSRLGQPGDIDVLIIPHRDGKLHIDKTAAIEVKRLSLRSPRWDKSTDRLGITQANGLLEAGFPYVGLLHLIVHAEGPVQNHRSMLTARVLDADGRISFEGEHTSDMTGTISCERQLGRLLAHNPDRSIGLNCVSLSDIELLGERGVRIGMPRGRTALKNPKSSQDCLLNIARFVTQFASSQTGEFTMVQGASEGRIRVRRQMQ